MAEQRKRTDTILYHVEMLRGVESSDKYVTAWISIVADEIERLAREISERGNGYEL